jgi:hypothetical protein
MVWFKVDDSLSNHPKVAAAGNAAMGLWLRAGAWSAHHLTDGFVPSSALPGVGGNRRQAEALVKAGLWTVEPDGYRFHDWQEYQPSRAKVEAAREATASRVREWRQRQQE